MIKEIYESSVIFKRPLVKLKVDRTPILVTKKTSGGVSKPYYVNAYTSEGSFNLQDVAKGDYQVIKVYSKETLGCKIMLDEGMNAVALIYCSLDTSNIIKMKRKRTWVEQYRKYVFPDKSVYDYFSIYDTMKYKVNKNNMFAGLERNLIPIDSPGFIKDEYDDEYWDQTDVMAPFRKMWGSIVPIQGNRMVALDNINMVLAYLCHKSVSAVKKGKKQESVDELVKYELPDPENKPLCIQQEDTNKRSNRYLNPMYENLQKYAVIQKVEGVNEPMCVIRTFFYSPQFDETKEGGRIYVGKKEVLSCKITEEGTYMYQALLDKPVHWDFCIEDFDADITRGTKLEYYGEIVKEIHPKHRGLAIWSFLKWPFFEKMYKIDTFKKLSNDIFCLSKLSTPVEIVGKMFGKVHIDEKNFYKAIGMNKQQAELIVPMMEKFYFDVSQYGYVVGIPICKFIKSTVADAAPDGFIDISSVDVATVEFVVEQFKVVNEKEEKYRPERECYWTTLVYYLSDVASKTRQVYGLKTMKKMFPKLIALVRESNSLIHLSASERRYTWGLPHAVYNDYINMVQALGMQSRFGPDFDTIEQLGPMHDTVTELYNMHKDEVERAKWDKAMENSNTTKWVFDKEGLDFIVIKPETPDDLAEEGITLHHCVKSYIGKVANGLTNIMFIRKRTEPTIPFFTVEIDNSGCIQQVHGFGNCNADTVEGLEDFLKKWVKERMLSMNSINKVR